MHATLQTVVRRGPARAITSADVPAVLASTVIVQVVDHRDRFVLLGQIIDRPLIAVVADDECGVDEYGVDEDAGFALGRVLQRHAPPSGRVVMVDRVVVRAA